MKKINANERPRWKYMGIILFISAVATIAVYDAKVSAAEQETLNDEATFTLSGTETTQSVKGITIILGRKNEMAPECVINTSLAGVSDESGFVRISHVEPGDYVVFYTRTASPNTKLNGVVVNYDPVDRGGGARVAQLAAIRKSLNLKNIVVLTGGQFKIHDGNLVVNGYLYAEELDLGMKSEDGGLWSVHLPRKEKSPVLFQVMPSPEKN